MVCAEVGAGVPRLEPVHCGGSRKEERLPGFGAGRGENNCLRAWVLHSDKDADASTTTDR